MKKPITKKEIKAYLDHKWDERRAKSRIRAKKTSELTKAWKAREAVVKYLEELKRLNPSAVQAQEDLELELEKSKSRRTNYITFSDSP